MWKVFAVSGDKHQTCFVSKEQLITQITISNMNEIFQSESDRIYVILIINSVIRLFLLTRFLKNYTTNFDETLHTL